MINATSVGMGDRSEASPVDASSLVSASVVFDVVARPRKTLFLGHARKVGCATVDGITMVAHQAVSALEWLAGVKPNLSFLKERFG